MVGLLVDYHARALAPAGYVAWVAARIVGSDSREETAYLAAVIRLKGACRDVNLERQATILGARIDLLSGTLRRRKRQPDLRARAHALDVHTHANLSAQVMPQLTGETDLDFEVCIFVAVEIATRLTILVESAFHLDVKLAHKRIDMAAALCMGFTDSTTFRKHCSNPPYGVNW